MKTRDEEIRLERFRQAAKDAEIGWLPPLEEREEINQDVLVKCLGISPNQTRPHLMSMEQRLELAVLWFEGREAEIPYEDWGLERPPWIPKD